MIRNTVLVLNFCLMGMVATYGEGVWQRLEELEKLAK